MMYFLIPLKSKHSSSDWSKVEALLHGTLNSIYNQSSDNYKVAIALHDEPDIDLPESFKKKIDMIRVDYPEPDHVLQARRLDKHNKKRYLANYVYQNGGGNMMFVDSDDYVNSRITQFVEENPSDHGWYIAEGYEYLMNLGKVKPTPKFDKFCGTCAILNLKKDDLPPTPQHESYDEEKKLIYLFDHGHNTWVDTFAKAGRPLNKLPFRGAMYTLASDESITSINKFSNGGGLKRRLYRTLVPAVMSKKKIKKEFGLDLNK